MTGEIDKSDISDIISKASEGDAESQYQLGCIYRNGKGLPQSYIHAHIWFNIARANGSVVAGEALKGFVKELTPEGIERAQEKAAEMVEKKFELAIALHFSRQ